MWVTEEVVLGLYTLGVSPGWAQRTVGSAHGLITARVGSAHGLITARRKRLREEMSQSPDA